MIEFKIKKRSTKSKARIGSLKTSHGDVETPAYVSVATQGVIKTLTSEEVEATGAQLLIANTYHLHIRPGEAVLKKHGGLHKFMNWKRPIMTDSGGFQVFSLGFGRDFQTGKILKKESDTVIALGQQPKLLKITPDGVMFRSYHDGSEMFLGPKESIKIQEAIGADIIFAFDECTSPMADHAYTKKSLEHTNEWAKICLKTKKSDQALYGIVQGGKFKDLRTESAQFIGSLPFDGFGIGGEFGADKRSMTGMLDIVTKELPENKPRHLLGIGHLDDIIPIMRSGIDTFDCIAPTHYARHGYAFTSKGKLDLKKATFLTDKKPLDPKCSCFVCQNYSRGYITHLLKANEITPLKLLTFHNMYFFHGYVKKVREEIKKGKTVKQSIEHILTAYDYALPEARIAQKPASPRDSAKLLTYNRATGTITEDTFAHIGDYLPKNAVLVFNQTKVIPARLTVTKPTGGTARILYIGKEGSDIKAMSDRKLIVGTDVRIAKGKFLTVMRQEGKYYFLRPSFPLNDLESVLHKHGITPIPPYIKESPLNERELRKKYQTIFAKQSGSVAAPTASLHFTERLFKKLQKQGIDIRFVTLHVNIGTFAPLTQEHLDTGALHAEWYEIDKETAKFLDTAKAQGRPIIGVGTTVVRTLESACIGGKMKHLQGETRIFIQEGYRFSYIDGMVTNFHVPQSSLLMLVAALIGKKKLFELYALAIKRKFRFFSFGDGMLIY